MSASMLRAEDPKPVVDADADACLLLMLAAEDTLGWTSPGCPTLGGI